MHHPFINEEMPGIDFNSEQMVPGPDSNDDEPTDLEWVTEDVKFLS